MNPADIDLWTPRPVFPSDAWFAEQIGEEGEEEGEDPLEEERARLESSYLAFYREAWHVLEPGTQLIETWELHCMIDHAEAWARGQCPWLIIGGPRGMGKSYPLSRILQPYIWAAIDPGNRLMGGSCDQALGETLATDARRLMESEWYQERWGRLAKRRTDRKVIFASDQNAKLYYRNERGGFRKVVSIGGGIGRRAGDGLLDDPQTEKIARSPAENEANWLWVSRTFIPALDDSPERPSRLLVAMQGLHKSDTVARLTERYRTASGCKFDTVYIQQRKVIFPVGTPHPTRGYTCTALTRQGIIHDPRTRPGELLNPVRWPEEDVRMMERDLGMFNAQQQQMPDDGATSGAAWSAFRPEQHEWAFSVRDILYAIGRQVETNPPRIALIVDCGATDMAYALLDSWWREPCTSCGNTEAPGWIPCFSCRGRRGGCSVCVRHRPGLQVCRLCSGRAWRPLRFTLGDYQSKPGHNLTQDNIAGILRMIEECGLIRVVNGHSLADPGQIDEYLIDNMIGGKTERSAYDPRAIKTEAERLADGIGLRIRHKQVDKSVPRATSYANGDALFAESRVVNMVEVGGVWQVAHWENETAISRSLPRAWIHPRCRHLQQALSIWQHDTPHGGHEGLSHAVATYVYGTNAIFAPASGTRGI